MASLEDLTQNTTTSYELCKFSNVSRLVIKLTPVAGESSAVRAQRQKQASAATATTPSVRVNCDGVTWTCDDMKIVTSQSSPTKVSDLTEIIPGSQMIYVWDSRSGKCLMGITSSHSSLCSVIAPHPALPSVVASAGADGVVNVWDVERGDCFFTHTNILKHGPAASAADRGKKCGYLEAQFSPDGLTLVLTDENGRVTILDSLSTKTNLVRLRADPGQTASNSSDVPAWMLEQYFANDYYDLAYDTNGYCVESGTGLPPHLAPRGERCTHEGTSYSELDRLIYKSLEGPLPLSPRSVRWGRDQIRAQSAQIRSASGLIRINAREISKQFVRGPDRGIASKSTAIITKAGKLVHSIRKSVRHRISNNAPRRTSSNSARQLSNRYEWRDAFEELSDGDNEDQDDEDYDENRHGPGRRLEDDDEELLYDDDNYGSPDQSRRNRSGRGRSRAEEENREPQQPARASSRQITQRRYEEMGSDDEELNEMMSTHTEPTGPELEFEADWSRSQHLFRMSRGDGAIVQRKWVSRTSYGDFWGQKFYCPQVGDSGKQLGRS